MHETTTDTIVDTRDANSAFVDAAAYMRIRAWTSNPTILYRNNTAPGMCRQKEELERNGIH
jgi:hypothetical protein